MVERLLSKEEIREQLHLCSICGCQLRDVPEITQLAKGSYMICSDASINSGDTAHLHGCLPIPTECLGLLGLRLRLRGRDYQRRKVRGY